MLEEHCYTNTFTSTVMSLHVLGVPPILMFRKYLNIKIDLVRVENESGSAPYTMCRLQSLQWWHRLNFVVWIYMKVKSLKWAGHLLYTPRINPIGSGLSWQLQLGFQVQHFFNGRLVPCLLSPRILKGLE